MSRAWDPYLCKSVIISQSLEELYLNLNEIIYKYIWDVEAYWATLIIVLTHPALVWNRPRCEESKYSLKNCVIDIPRNSESPVMMRFLIEFILVNWRNDNPTEAENKETSYIKERNKKKTKFSYKTGCSLKLQLYSVK